MYELRDHQRKAVEELHNGSILCGETGSGKSFTALVYYYTKVGLGELDINENGSFQKMRDPKDLYIITTAKKRDDMDWQKECIPFLISDNPELNYDNRMKLIVDSWNNITKYTDVENSFFIFDEQRVVGYGVWTKSFLKIAKKNQWIMLSATPADTWIDYMPVFIANGFYKNKTEFTQMHVIYNPRTDFPKVDRYVGCKRLAKNRDKILVRMEMDKGHISIHNDVVVEYNREFYKSVMRDRWDPYKESPIQTPGALYYILRRIVNEDVSRLEAMDDILDTHPKAIIFYNFDYELEILRDWCQEHNHPYSEWNGHNHENILDTDVWVYLVQYSAGAEGWNCIQTDTMIFYSQHYSYRITTQAAGRIDRLNTPFEKLYYYHLLSMAPIDLSIKRSLKEKKNFNKRQFTKEVWE